MANAFYEPNKKYNSMIVDLLSPECNVFVVGLNGDVREYPTKEWVELSGAQLNLLMTCTIPVEETETVNDRVRIIGHRETPRFAINVSGFGAMPASDAVVLGQGANPTPKPKTKKQRELIVVSDDLDEELTQEEKELVNQPGETLEGRKAVLQAATREELIAYCDGKNIEYKNTDNAKVIINKILKAEGLK